jgi:hypothetical protein
MKFIAGAALVAAQMLAAAQPAGAAELPSDRSAGYSQLGTFAGARLRVPLGGGREKAQAGLALTSTLRSGATGELRFARGAELGFASDETAVRLTLGGTPVSRLAQGAEGPRGRREGISTLGWIAIGVGAAAIIVVAAAAACVNDDDCIGSE